MIEQKEIRSIRKKYGLTQGELAEILHLSLQTIKFYEACTRKASACVLDLLSYKVQELQEQKNSIS